MSSIVSVIMPVHDGVKIRHLSEAINSIISQEFSGKIELLCIQDGPISIDKKSFINETVRRHKHTNIRVRILENKFTRGVSGARNTGLEEACGNFIAFLDSDDVSLSYRIKLNLDHLETSNADVLTTSCYVIDDDSKIVGYRRSKNGFLTFFDFLQRCPVNFPTSIIRATVASKCRFNEKLQVSEDYDFWINIMNNDFKISSKDCPTTFYRQDKNTLKKRRGWNYFINDLYVKKSLWKQLTIAHRIKYLYIFIAPVIRLLPARVFSMVYFIIHRP